MAALSEIAGHVLGLAEQGARAGVGPDAELAFSRLLHLLPLASRARDELLFQHAPQALSSPPLLSQVEALFQIVRMCVRIISPGHVRITTGREWPVVPELTALGAFACDFLSEVIEDVRRIPQLRPRLRPVMDLLCSDIFPQILTQPNNEPIGLPCGLLQATMGCGFYASFCNLLRVYWEEEFRESAQLRVLELCTSMVHICDSLCDRVRVPSARKSIFIPQPIALHVLLVCGRICAEFRSKFDTKLKETFASAQEIFNAYDTKFHLPMRRREQQTRMEKACGDYFRVATGFVAPGEHDASGDVAPTASTASIAPIAPNTLNAPNSLSAGRAWDFYGDDLSNRTAMEALLVLLEASGGECFPAVGHFEELVGSETDALLLYFHKLLANLNEPEASSVGAPSNQAEATGGHPEDHSAGKETRPSRSQPLSFVWQDARSQRRGRPTAQRVTQPQQPLPVLSLSATTSPAEAIWRIRATGCVADYLTLGSRGSSLNKIDYIPLYIMAVFGLQGRGLAPLCNQEVRITPEELEGEARECITADPLLLLPHEGVRTLLFACYLKNRPAFPTFYRSLLALALSSGKHAPGIISSLVHGPPCPLQAVTAPFLLRLAGLSAEELERRYGVEASAELGVSPEPAISLLFFLGALFAATRGTSQSPQVKRLVAETLQGMSKVPYTEYRSILIAFASLAVIYPDFVDFCGVASDSQVSSEFGQELSFVDSIRPSNDQDDPFSGPQQRAGALSAAACAEIERAAARVAMSGERFDLLSRLAGFFIGVRPDLAVSLFLAMRSPLCGIRSIRVRLGLLSPVIPMLPPSLRSLLHAQLVRGLLGRAVGLIKSSRAERTSGSGRAAEIERELQETAMAILRLEPSVVMPSDGKDPVFSFSQGARPRAVDAYTTAHAPSEYLLVIIFALHGNPVVLRPLYKTNPVTALTLMSAARSSPLIVKTLLDDGSYRETFSAALGDVQRLITSRVSRAYEERRTLEDSVSEIERMQKGIIANPRNLGIRELEARRSELQQERLECNKQLTRLTGELKDRLELDPFRDKGFEALFGLYERVWGLDSNLDAKQFVQSQFLRGLTDRRAFSMLEMLDWIASDPACGERMECAEIVMAVLNNPEAFDSDMRQKWLRQFMGRRGVDRFQEHLRSLL